MLWCAAEERHQMQELRQAMRDLGGFLLPPAPAPLLAPAAAHSRPAALERSQPPEPCAGDAAGGSALAAAEQPSTGHAALAAARLSRLRQLREEAAAALPAQQACGISTERLPEPCPL